MNDKAQGKHSALLRLLVAFLLSLSLLPGCSGNQPDTSSTAAENPSTQSEAAQEQPAESQQPSVANQSSSSTSETVSAQPVDLASIPKYSGAPYVEVQGNTPQFTEEDKARGSFEDYSPLDSLRRCGVAFALIGAETMPTEKRGSIGDVKPSGWHTVRYNGVVDGNYLYNRCHLIGYQLAGENANPKNLITGTRYLNTQGMLPLEDRVASYVEKTGNHVLYRVTPLFSGDNLVASGVQMEALSVEDDGAGISFNVYCYNVQPQITIDYATGESSLSEKAPSRQTNSTEQTYVLNTSSKKFHTPGCSAISRMKESNKQSYSGTRDSLIAQGYTPCGLCKP